MSIKELKEREKEQRRQYILDAAEKLFISKGGYDNVTMKDIADEVGLNKSTLYLYFKNKEAIYLHLMLRLVKIIYAAFKEGIEKGRTGMEKVEAMETMVFESTKNPSEYLEMYCLQQPKGLDLEYIMKSEYETAKEVTKIFEKMFDIICDAIKTGIADGTIRHDVDPVGTAALLLLIDKSVMDMPLGLRNAMENKGTDFQKFTMEISSFKRHMLMNKEVKKD